jgi:hypothetical protein
MIYEVRNYHFRPDLLEAYKAWARATALPYLASKMDVVGFWVNTADPVEVTGEPRDPLGPANIGWVVRWRDFAHREADWNAALATQAWADILATVPGGVASFLRTESRFAETLL